MKPNTAVSIALLALANAATLRSGERVPMPLRLLGAVVAALAVVTAAQDLLDASWGVDTWFIPPSPATAQRMSPATASVIACLGVGVACGVGSAAARKARDSLTLVGGSIATLAVLGHVLGAKALYEVRPFSSIAPHTAVCLVLLAVAQMLAIDASALPTLLGDKGVGAALVRRLLRLGGWVVVLAILVGLAGRVGGWFGPEFGFALFLLLVGLGFAGFVWSSVRELDRLEDGIAAAAAQLVRQQNVVAEQQRLSAMMASAQDAIVSADKHGKVFSWNPAAERVFGYSATEMIGMPLTDLMPERFRRAHTAGMARYLKEGEAKVVGKTIELVGLHRDGSEFPCELSLAVWQREGTPYFTGFIRDIRDRVQARETVQKSELRFRTLVKNAPVAIFETDVAGHCIFVNRRYMELTELDMASASGQGWTRALHPEDRDRVFHEWSLAAKERRPFACDYRFLRGTRVAWVMGAATPLLDAGGKLLGYLGTVVDITEAHLAAERVASSLAEKEVLLREVHHRVKNNLQVISSLLRLQASRIQNAEAREIFLDSQSRVHSIALLHDSLYKSENLARVDMAQYVDKLAGAVNKTYNGMAERVDVTSSIQNVRLPLDVAVPCGLIINELLTNAYKHAFTGRNATETEGFRIHVQMQQADVVRLTVQDNGVGIPADTVKRHRESLGLTLIMTLARQLGAEVAFDGSHGTRCDLSFSVAFAEQEADSSPGRRQQATAAS